MDYRLALDLGTSSIGLVAYRLEDGNPVEVAYHAVRIFSEPLLPAKSGGVGETKKSARRVARQARRQIERRARRLRKIAYLAPLLGLDPANVPPDSGQSLHQHRASSIQQPIGLDDLLRVLLSLAKSRGYAGGFRVKSDDQDAGKVETGISLLKQRMVELNCTTVGEFLASQAARGETTKLKNLGLYAERAMLEEEFDQIWEQQRLHHACMNDEFLGRPVKDHFREAIFYQRPLKSPAPMTGQCSLEPSLKRAPLAQPSAQVFRIEKQIADLRWGNTRTASVLSDAQKDVIRSLLSEQKAVPFKTIYKALAKAGVPQPDNVWLNMDLLGRDDLRGDLTRAAWRRLKVTEEWDHLNDGDQCSLINLLADMGSPVQFSDHQWHQNIRKNDGTRRVFRQPVVDFIETLIATNKFERLSKMGLDAGRSSYSVKALRAMAHTMRTQGVDEYQAIAQLYPAHHESSASAELMELGKPEQTGNIVVDGALRQVRREVNNAIRILGAPPKETIVELVRDMGLGLKGRNEIQKRNASNQRERKSAIAAIETHGLAPTRTAIFRYRLWTEQDQSWCPYCTRPITLSDALNGGETHFEHIFPKSLTRIGKQRDFIVLSHNSCNHEKGDRTPREAWGEDDERWQVIEMRAKRFKQKRSLGKARQLLSRDVVDGTLDDAAIADFSARQYHESSWIAKLTAQWMRSICPDVMVSRGLLTAHLRRTWRLETVIPQIRYEEGMPVLDEDGQEIDQPTFEAYQPSWEGHTGSAAPTDRKPDKRIDHRHHLIDALVIGLCDRALYQRMARQYKADHEAGTSRIRLNAALPLDNLREIAIDLIRNSNLTHKPDRYAAGRLFEATAYGTSQDGDHLTLRKSIQDLAGKQPNATTLFSNIEKIDSEITREIVRRVITDRLNSGLPLAETISQPILFHGYQTPIRKVRIRANNSDQSVTIQHQSRAGVHEKKLIPDGFSCLELHREEDGRHHARLVPLHQAIEHGEHVVRRFFKGDMVRDARDQEIYVVRQIKSQGNGSLFLSRSTETRNVDQMNAGSGRKIVSAGSIRNLELIEDV